MLKLPDDLTAESFLARYWQKKPLFIPGALPRLRPSVTRNELAWLATLDDVESRIVFTERENAGLHYRMENGPFDAEFLAALPKRDWTLLVHDADKHLPSLRALFAHVPFIPDWRIDDLMISFAAPGGGVGPHRDNYDVFLCQGIGVREWRVSIDDPGPAPRASGDLALLKEFDGSRFDTREGDVLYLPPGVAHWGTARRACMTYSIGMRAPQLADLAVSWPDDDGGNTFYTDADLSLDEVAPGFVSQQATVRALEMQNIGAEACDPVALAFGCCVTTTKEWLTPEPLSDEEAETALRRLDSGVRLDVHGMARIAWNADHVFVNGQSFPLNPAAYPLIEQLCRTRHLTGPIDEKTGAEWLKWMLLVGAFETHGNL